MTNEKANQEAWRRDIKGQLDGLRAALPSPLGAKSSSFFDEFIREHEFGLALHVICDHLLEPATQPASAAIIQEIQSLHRLMNIEDDCVSDLHKNSRRAAES